MSRNTVTTQSANRPQECKESQTTYFTSHKSCQTDFILPHHTDDEYYTLMKKSTASSKASTELNNNLQESLIMIQLKSAEKTNRIAALECQLKTSSNSQQLNLKRLVEEKESLVRESTYCQQQLDFERRQSGDLLSQIHQMERQVNGLQKAKNQLESELYETKEHLTAANEEVEGLVVRIAELDDQATHHDSRMIELEQHYEVHFYSVTSEYDQRMQDAALYIHQLEDELDKHQKVLDMLESIKTTSSLIRVKNQMENM